MIILLKFRISSVLFAIFFKFESFEYGCLTQISFRLYLLDFLKKL